MKRFLLVVILCLVPTLCLAQQFSLAPVYIGEVSDGSKLANRTGIEAKAVYAQQGIFAGYQVRLANGGSNTLDWQRIEFGGDPVFLMSKYPPQINIPSKYLLFYSLDFIDSPYWKQNKFNGGGIKFITRQNNNIIDLSIGLQERSGYTAEAKFGWIRTDVFATIGVRQQKFSFSDDLPIYDDKGKAIGTEAHYSTRVITSGMLELGLIF